MSNLNINERKSLDFPPVRKSFENLRVAVVVSERLFQYISLDAEVFLLTKKNFKYILNYAQIDFLLFEPSIHYSIVDWDYALIENSQNFELLNILLLYAKSLTIPIVLWKTCANLYSNAINKLLQLFDLTYSTSMNDQLLLGNKFKYLQHATQPKIYHPLTNLSDKVDIKSKHILFDFAFSIECNKALFENLQDLQRFNIKLIDSNNSNINNKNISHPNFNDQFIGSCTFSERKKYLRNSKAAISFEMASGYTEYNVWNDLEILAMGVPLIYHGSLDDLDVRKNIVFETTDMLEIRKELTRLNDEQYQSRMSQICFRKINQEHTLSHRLNTICNDLHLNKRWDEYPLTTVCIATHRKELLNNCLENFMRQNYPKKELIIAYNGVENIDNTFNSITHDSIKFIRTPREAALGCALNCAIHKAEGEYFLKMDDDDFYAENYISDMILTIRFVDIDIFGKPQNNFFRFENDDFLYKRHNKRGDRYFVRMDEDLIRNSQIIIGNSISGKTDFLKKILFHENMYRHTDTCFEKAITTEEYKNYIAVCDCFNMIVERQKDISFHTWRIDEKSLKNKCDSFYTFQDAIV